MITRHLDLGCGAVPRNPYGHDEAHGIDIALPAGAEERFFRRANLSIDRIPHADGSFDSVSAFDFFEHVPRVLVSSDGRGTRFPFIELMNEIHRVLRPGGRLWALTPAYPAAEAFQDPTHVNIITDRTHEYFCGAAPLGRMYGFAGSFRCLRSEWAVAADAAVAAPLTWKQVQRRWRRRLKGQLTHLLWEFEAAPGNPPEPPDPLERAASR